MLSIVFSISYAAATVGGTTDRRFNAEDAQFLLRSSISIC